MRQYWTHVPTHTHKKKANSSRNGIKNIASTIREIYLLTRYAQYIHSHNVLHFPEKYV